jgi:hypothetical protein
MKHILAVTALLLLGSGALADDPPRFTDWGPAENLGPVINGPYLDSCVSISKDGLTIIFSSNRHTGNPVSTDRDLYVSKRASIDEPWGEPQPLTVLNSPFWDSCPALSLDEHRLYFTSQRPGCGGHDIWVSRRRDRKDDLGWEAPVNLGCATDGFVNSAGSDLFPTFFEDETGRVLMYFGSNRAGSFDLYQSEMRGDDTFGPATPVVELNSPAMEHSVTVRRDGLEIIFGSNRSGEFRFWTSTRASTSDPWSPPVMVTSLPAGGAGRFALSRDGRELYFSAALPGTKGGIDIWVARRERLR